jgi:hypothetical protein
VSGVAIKVAGCISFLPPSLLAMFPILVLDTAYPYSLSIVYPYFPKLASRMERSRTSTLPELFRSPAA